MNEPHIKVNYNDHLNFEDSIVHIAFTNYPLGESERYLQYITKIYEQHKNTFKDRTKEEYDTNSFLFSPLKFHIFGQFDLALISLIDTYKFAQKVFDCIHDPWDGDKSISYQITTGAVFKQNLFDLKRSFQMAFKCPFILISQIKLNNGLLIGNGNDFATLVSGKIHDLFKEYVHILINTFSWCEFTLLVFHSDFKTVSFKLQELREMQLKSIAGFSPIIKNSLYKEWKFDDELISNSHCIIDSNSYFGYQIDTNKTINYPSAKLKTIIEWQVKPGHLNEFIDKLSKFNFHNQISFTPGKFDYATNNSAENFDYNFNLRKYLTIDETNEDSIIHEIRKIKTTPFFEPYLNSKIVDKDSLINDENKNINNIQKELKRLRISDVGKLYNDLKSLKLSRSIRMKILKVFFNYNNAITDPIFYIFHIDFRNFLIDFKLEIENDVKNVSELNLNRIMHVSVLEVKYSKYLNSFQGAYLNRILNNFNFEEINDFNIDFNSSITHLISSLDSLVKLISKSLGKKYNFIVQTSDSYTEANDNTINYNVYHLIEPSLVFTTLSKEILNSIIYDFINNDNIKYKYINSPNVVLKESSIKYHGYSNLNKSFNEEIKEHGFIELHNFELKQLLIDIIRCNYTFNYNVELFIFWHWIYIFQSSSQYKIDNNLDSNKIYIEIFRVILLHTFLGDKIELTCPSYLISFEWELKFNDYLSISRKLNSTYRQIVMDIIYTIPSESKEEFTITDISKELINDLNNVKVSELLNVDQRELLNNKYLNIKSILNESGDRAMTRWINLETFLIINNGSFSLKEILKFSSDNGRQIYGLAFNLISYYILNYFMNKIRNDNKLMGMVLPRKENSGEPNNGYIENNIFKLFIDSNGDFYHTSREKLADNVSINHEIIYQLWDISLKYKKELFK